MAYHRGTTLVTQRTYSYDTLGRPLTRSTARNGQTVNDSFMHNSRSELASAQVNGITYGYDYDNIGNRRMAMESSDYTLYEANALNQYTSIQENDDTAFVPSFDTDGNQTLVKTSTGIWSVQYNAENRPVCFTSADNSTIIECVYDTQGRRATKKVITNGSVTLHQRYIYHDYLQIATCDLTRSGHPCLWLLTWDPTQTIATRPLAIRKDGTWYAYGWDLTKNICEVFGQHGYLRTAYTYSPYGEVSAEGDVTQPIQWSSEYNDTETALVYYNYRHYNPVDGRWIGREPLNEHEEWNVYIYVQNKPINNFDVTGLFIDTVWDVGNMLWDVGEIVVGAVTGNKEMMETGAVNLAFDTAAAVIPGVPAGVSKMVKTTTKKGVKQGVKRTPKKKQKEKKDETPDGCKSCIHRAGTLMHQIALPGSRVRGAHKCDMVGHVKVWKMNQAPYPKCTCH